MHARKTLLFTNGKCWMKKQSNGTFDVAMGSYDGAEICDLVGIYILNSLAAQFTTINLGLYRDDGLAVLEDVPAKNLDRFRKDLHKAFKDMGLRITAQTNLKVVNFLDITLDLTNGKYYPYRKPNDLPIYIHRQSNHPPPILKNLPASIEKRVSDNSYDRESFNQVAPIYTDALRKSKLAELITYKESNKNNGRSRPRNKIWYNPPFCKSVVTNVGRKFLTFINKHFHKHPKLSKIFNRNNIKISYSCMPNLKSIIKAHNSKILSKVVPKQKITCATVGGKVIAR
jgi:hypothetical protein